MRRQKLAVLIALATMALAMVAASALAEEPGLAPLFGSTADDRERVALWNECRPMSFVVDYHNHELDNRTVPTLEDIETAVRRRLVIARLHSSRMIDALEGGAGLQVSVSVGGPRYSVDIYYVREVWEPVTEVWTYASTFNVGSIGIHVGAANSIVSNVSEQTDRFIEEYLRVNADACR
ncbi:MAG: hypothetical protein OXU19_14925 [bacterium]|nr:hypothetical protein [bacterium]MDE0416721.1 hypothetical protein [bacterium]